jgi:GMP synthase (glutamine-hydrolysing)
MFIYVINYGDESATKISNVLTVLKTPHSIINPYDNPKQEFSHIILSGGPKHVYEPDHYYLADWIINCKQKVLAICYGMQLVAHTFGGEVIRMDNLEYGLVPIISRDGVKLHCMNRRDQVIKSPFEITEITDKGHIAAFTDYKKYWCFQYHPESYRFRDYEVFIRFLKLT